MREHVGVRSIEEADVPIQSSSAHETPHLHDERHGRAAGLAFCASARESEPLRHNDVALSQLNAMVVLLESFIQSLTVVLPFYPYGTMERVIKEGQIATANTMAKLFSKLPPCAVLHPLHAPPGVAQDERCRPPASIWPCGPRALSTSYPRLSSCPYRWCRS